MKLDELSDIILIDILSNINYDVLLEFRLLNKRMSNLILNTFLHIGVTQAIKSEREEEEEEEIEMENFYIANALKVKHLTYDLTRERLDLIKHFKNIKSLTIISTDFGLDNLKEINELDFQKLNTVNLELNKSFSTELSESYLIPNILQHVQNFKIVIQQSESDIIIPMLSCLNPSKIKELRIISTEPLDVNSYEFYICSFINLEILEIQGNFEVLNPINLNM